MGKFHSLFKLNTIMMDLAGKALSLKRYPYLLSQKAFMKRNSELKNLRKSDTCYILGMGPSLKGVDLSKIDGDIFTVNGFYNFAGAKEIKPDFYCVTDTFAFTRTDDDMLANAMDMFPDATFLLNGLYQKEAAEKIGERKNKTFFSYAWSGYFNPHKKIDFTKNLPIMGNIVCHVIMAAMYMGYKRIILLGCDFNSFASRHQSHCYEDAVKERSLALSYELFCYSFCADEHDQLAQYAKDHGIEIVNATNGSLIDAYYYDEDLIQHYLK